MRSASPLRHSSLLPRLLTALVLTAGACASVSAETETAQQGDQAADVETSSSTAPTQAPTSRPEPSLTAVVHDDGGLVDITLDVDTDWERVGVSIDGELRAVHSPGAVQAGDAVATVWIPPGNHTVCVGDAHRDALPVFWSGEDSGTPVATQLWTPSICGQAHGTIDSPARILPDNRIIAHYGTGKTETLGILGEGTPAEATERLALAASEYEGFGLPVLPAFEFIATVATRLPENGSYTKARPHFEIRPYLRGVRSVGGILVLDLQPGRDSFIDQARTLENFLIQPDVHLALDPEWSMEPDQVPGRAAGKTDAAAVNEVLVYLDELVVRHGLPEKLLIVHQFTSAMIQDRADIVDPAGSAVLFHIEAHGTPGAKMSTYDLLSVQEPFFNGFKIYFDEDTDVMSPTDVMSISPLPLFISYQ